MERHPSLPSHDDIQKLFDTGKPAEGEPLEQEYAKKIYERIDLFRKILDELLQPERLLAMQEASFLDDRQRETVTGLLQEMMRLDRMLLLAELDNTPDGYAAFVAEAVRAWPGISARMRPVLVRLHEGWTLPLSQKQIHSYLG